MHVVVVGGGFSGSMLAVQLLQQPGFAGRITWYERAAAWGQGIAYGTECPAHVLNVPAQNMSAYPDRPGHLLDWLEAQTPAPDRTALRDTFVARPTYARYLEATCAPIFAQAGSRLTRVRDEVVDVRALADGASEVIARSQPPCVADHVALCVGHFAPKLPPVAGAEHLVAPTFVANPWQGDALARIPDRGVVATLGAGLTMVDVVLALQHRGFAGQLVAVSRRGLWPRTHVTQPSSIHLEAPAPADCSSAAALLRWLRASIRRHVAHGGDWRQVLDAMRGHTVATWRSLAPADQARILRHAKSLWDAHRHRVAPHVGRQLTALRHEGRLLHHAGRLDRVSPGKRPNSLVLHWRLRHHAEVWRQEVDALVNCTGVHNDWSRSGSVLAESLLASGRVAPGPHRMGLALTPEGRVVDRGGAPNERLWAMGPARLGMDFESVAVPELRLQAAELARAIAAAR